MADSDTHTIVAVHITDRIKEAVDIQKVLTQYGGSETGDGGAGRL